MIITGAWKCFFSQPKNKYKQTILALKVLSKIVADNILDLFALFFRESKIWYFHVNHLLGRQFTWNVKPYFSLKEEIDKKNNNKVN